MCKRLFFVCFALSLLAAAIAQAKVSIAPVPDEIRTDRFTVTIDGHPASFAHAAANYYFLNFDLKGKAKIAITAPADNYWGKGVEVQPWSLNIRPALSGRTITFTLKHPAKLSITRPGDHLAGAEMLFLFANSLEAAAPKPADPKIRYYAPGVHHESIDAHTGDTIYLAPGAVIFGSLNIWQVENVKVFGRGIIVYDGPQDPNDDTGWKHQPNWHCIVMDNARNIEISGITCVVRSRTWMIQMKESRFITFDNVKVIGGSNANANQDGMDWLGGGDTVVRDVFIRAADDVFAMQGNWDGYSHEAMIAPGHDVTNITVENSVLSTSISNIVRAAWPEKVFNGANFTLRDSDIIHAGIGSCGIPFALLDFWATNGATGHTSGYHFENLRLEDWYSLVQIEQPNPSVRDISFKNIWAIETPSLVPSTLLGDVDGITFDHVRLADKVAASNAGIPLNLESGAKQPTYVNTTPRAAFTYSAGPLRPHQKITFDASPSGSHIHTYEWFFGDGATATGRKVHHKFPDAAGTLWDNSGRFRVTLKTTADDGSTDWLYQPVVVSDNFHTADPKAGTEAGGYLNVPADGGYTFTLFSRDEARLEIDSVPIAISPKPFAQVCGSPGNAMQATSGSIGLRAGRHTIHVQTMQTTTPSNFSIKWQGPGLPLSDIPASASSH